MKKVFACCLLFSFSYAMAQNGFLKLTKQQLQDKIKGGWAGQTIGVTFGGPYEFRFQGTFIGDYQPLLWYNGYLKETMINNPGLYDDLYMDLTFVAREGILEQFEAAVLKAIDLPKEEQNKNAAKPKRVQRLRPVFKMEMVQEVVYIIKNYFPLKDQEKLLELLTTSKDVEVPLLFNGSGNQLADAFKQLYQSHIVMGCSKTELESWIQKNFQYNDNGVRKNYTEKYLQDIISSNTKPCQSPLFDVKRNQGKYFLLV